MADIQQDLYGLTYSTSFQIQGTQEEAVNLTLPPAPSLLATVVGTVTGGTVPIPNATVKLFDSTGMPYQHTMTDAAGEYTLDGIPAGTYSIAAVAPDYLMRPAAGVTLSTGDTITIPSHLHRRRHPGAGRRRRHPDCRRYRGHAAGRGEGLLAQLLGRYRGHHLHRR